LTSLIIFPISKLEQSRIEHPLRSFRTDGANLRQFNLRGRSDLSIMNLWIGMLGFRWFEPHSLTVGWRLQKPYQCIT